MKDLTVLTESKGEEQVKLKKQLCDQFYTMQHLLKLTLPLTPYQSDFVTTIKEADEVLIMDPPEKKIELGVEEDFEPGEWDSLPITDQLYFVSTYKWRNS